MRQSRALETQEIPDLMAEGKHWLVRISNSQLNSQLSESKIVYIYDDYEDYDIEDKNYKKTKKGHNNFLAKEAAFSSKVNTIIGLLSLAGILLIPTAVAAELNIERIIAQISELRDRLVEFYIDLSNTLASIVTTLTTITTSLATITTTLNTQATTLQTIITLINNIPRRKRRIENEKQTLMYLMDIKGDLSSDVKLQIDNELNSDSKWLKLCLKEAIKDKVKDKIICQIKGHNKVKWDKK